MPPMSGKYRTLATIVGVAVTSPAVVTVQAGANWLTLLGEMTFSAAWSRVLATFCPATGHDWVLAAEGEATPPVLTGTAGTPPALAGAPAGASTNPDASTNVDASTTVNLIAAHGDRAALIPPVAVIIGVAPSRPATQWLVPTLLPGHLVPGFRWGTLSGRGR